MSKAHSSFWPKGLLLALAVALVMLLFAGKAWWNITLLCLAALLSVFYIYESRERGLANIYLIGLIGATVIQTMLYNFVFANPADLFDGVSQLLLWALWLLLSLMFLAMILLFMSKGKVALEQKQFFYLAWAFGAWLIVGFRSNYFKGWLMFVAIMAIMIIRELRRSTRTAKK